MDMERKSLGKRINIARKDKKLTTDKLSEMCNINPTYLRQIESGMKIPSLQVFISICNALCISPSYLLQDEVNTPESQLKEFEELWKTASPNTQEMILDMIRTALQHLNK